MSRQSGRPVRPGSSPIHGQGVFAVDNVPAGALIGRYEGDPTESDGVYVLWVETENGWNAIEGTGVLRWLNHSSRPNAAFDGAELYAIAEIPAGTEVTIDYGPEWSGVG